jgi:hypothetical protein
MIAVVVHHGDGKLALVYGARVGGVSEPECGKHSAHGDKSLHDVPLLLCWSKPGCGPRNVKTPVVRDRGQNI